MNQPDNEWPLLDRKAGENKQLDDTTPSQLFISSICDDQPPPPVKMAIVTFHIIIA